MKKLILVLPILFSLSGCFGIGFVHPKTYEQNKFYFAGSSKTPVFTYPEPKQNQNKAEIISVLGKPDNVIRESQGNDIWRYRNGFDWVGVVPMFIIGIPLVLPLIPANTEIFFSGEQATKVVFTTAGWSGGCFCPNNEGQMKYGFHSLQ
jgi:hypothetical protein